MKNKWIILSDGWDPHIVEANDWYEALVSHMKWYGCTPNKIDLVTKALQSYRDMKQAIELFNLIFKTDPIDYMTTIDDKAYLNERCINNETN